MDGRRRLRVGTGSGLQADSFALGPDIPTRHDTTPSRRYTTPSRRYETPSRRYTTPSRRYETPSRQGQFKWAVSLTERTTEPPSG